MKRGVDHIGNAVVYYCHDGEGNVVFSKRNQNSRDEIGRWDIGGGGIEFGETAEDTLRKEIAEEYCTDVIDYEFLGFRNVFRENDGVKTHWISLDFKVRIDPKKVANGEPHKFDEVKMFSAQSFPEPLHSQFPLFFEKYKDRLLV